MSDTVIRVENLGKKYIIGHQQQERYTALRDVITNKVKSIGSLINPQAKNENPAFEEFWALKDVSFEIKQGDRVGIIGRNGAGKSTLLKILSRITEPTKGSIKIKGRVASLLEVGTGFHPELTGRENIFLNGAILGMGKEEIKRKFDEIVAFAEVEKFLDTPVKRYSSGMYVRLAFAVAAHLEPDILIVDEVLAVGDAAFQKKCLGKMEDVGKEGRTVLFVSHNMQAISTLTKCCLMLSKGKCIYQGKTEEGIAEYLREGCNEELVYRDKLSDYEPKITKVELRTTEPSNVQLNGESMEVHFEITTPVPIDGASLSFQVFNSLQQPVVHLWTFDSERPMCRNAGVFHLNCQIPKLRLYMGRYTLKVHFSERAGGKKFQTIEDICPFEVVMYGRSREFEWNPETCTYLEDSIWQINYLI
ncbi:ABC transporter ATP-binding protein [Dolichospermum sp. ST_sed1]|nr:ABC transporter ATP-binding protein [Dolichospermum sp. ST_sed1]MDD1424242.1 ABC transporter ATP-binding protein [Dolichospermum sp. ST_sed9]MDD1429760.1 ABC transporter ATP-binding protein [Dolichospermum sp. ST_sed6]MDD1440558.1 ABC transporter ATP-binding protein [Dolichospermum sp. ST_sed3]MDD1446114.1 ABC transporter ATP-binding protein [Dolichospermum sp. ST_sed8]MDD1454732.1 ABC transporter ATP-binding protein [Dolichospermum sp. ST_sed7]MDD1459612.1 ABC transporter ATP-binding prot